VPGALLPPDLRPLPLDPAAVAAAIAACQRAANLLGALAEDRARAAAEARLEWRGPTRDAFDHATLRLDAEAAELVVELVRAGAAIGSAAGEVRAENRRRTDRRDAWARANQLPG